MKINASERQRNIFLNGISGQRPELPIDLEALETPASSKLSKEAFAYIAGGAGKGHTMENNRSDFRNWRILPRMLKNVAVRDTSIELFGQRLNTPLLLCPIGVLELAHPEADVAVAKAAAKYEIPMIFSNQASVAMEETAAAMGNAPRWFQLYWSKSNDLISSFVKRAEQSGCSAIVVTLDTNILGWRTQDLDLAYLPFLQAKGIAQYVSDPVFQQLMNQESEDADPPKRKLNYNTLLSIYQLMKNYPDSFFQNLKTQRPLKAVRTFINTFSRPSLTWEELPFLRHQTQLPILLKGILHPEDAKRAIDYGMDGVIVSNHGGRQVDGAISSIAALPKVVEAVAGKIPVLMDSGIRTGADIFKALALGASAVCLGRPYVYGLALAGQAGVEAVLQNLLSDFELTMALSGCKAIEEIDDTKVVAQS
ncbi:MAG: lactate 2-monooxygenase [Bacteroidota bacterium]